MFILSESKDSVPSPARFSYGTTYYSHGGPQDRGSIILLKHGYFRNTSIPRGESYGTGLEIVPGTSLYMLTIINSDGLIVSREYLAWDDVAKREKLLLRKAKRSIFIGVPHRGMAIQSIWG